MTKSRYANTEIAIAHSIDPGVHLKAADRDRTVAVISDLSRRPPLVMGHILASDLQLYG